MVRGLTIAHSNPKYFKVFRQFGSKPMYSREKLETWTLEVMMPKLYERNCQAQRVDNKERNT
jgi:hypothetical protein